MRVKLKNLVLRYKKNACTVPTGGLCRHLLFCIAILRQGHHDFLSDLLSEMEVGKDGGQLGDEDGWYAQGEF